jgi:hypothetical protein
VALGGILALLVGPLARTHPYQSAYLNPVANGLAGPRAEEWLEVEYWGGAYKEGAAWITRHAEADAPVYVPIGEHLVAHYLGQERLAERNPSDFFDTSRPRYVMFITRSSWYPPWVRRVERSYEPVHTIRRQRATLLKIYSNHPRFRRHASGARPSRRAPVLREDR